jgi:stalled ribosome alternative rescue factor ArfA
LDEKSICILTLTTLPWQKEELEEWGKGKYRRKEKGHQETPSSIYDGFLFIFTFLGPYTISIFRTF